jgi:hypothetical protein
MTLAALNSMSFPSFAPSSFLISKDDLSIFDRFFLYEHFDLKCNVHIEFC